MSLWPLQYIREVDVSQRRLHQRGLSALMTALSFKPWVLILLSRYVFSLELRQVVNVALVQKVFEHLGGVGHRSESNRLSDLQMSGSRLGVQNVGAKD